MSVTDKAADGPGAGLEPPGFPRIHVLWQEAWSNLVSGTSRAFIFAAALMLLCGPLALTQVRLVADFVDAASTFRSSGAAIFTITLDGGINGAQCDALNSLPGIGASGALRAGPRITLAALPSTSIASLQATPAFASLLDFTQARPNPVRGVWVASDLASRLGIANPGTQLVLAPIGTANVAGIYDYPDDGRSPVLGYEIVSPVPATGAFDQCWLLAWPDPGRAMDLLYQSLLPRANAGNNIQPTVSQLNVTHGATFDAARRWSQMPLWLISLAGLTIGALLGFTSIRVRRLELASTLHSGIPKVALALQIAFESLVWLAIALLPTLALILLVARQLPPADWLAAFVPAVRTLLLASIAAMAGAQVATLLTFERHLFRYFKSR